jgi:hypothetical protein
MSNLPVPADDHQALMAEVEAAIERCRRVCAESKADPATGEHDGRARFLDGFGK